MKILKAGQHRLFENDPETARIVSELLLDLERHGMDAVRKYSQKFDGWSPDNFELSAAQINSILSSVPPRVVHDTEYCQGNVRRFAQEQLKTLLPLSRKYHPSRLPPEMKICQPLKLLEEYLFTNAPPLLGALNQVMTVKG